MTTKFIISFICVSLLSLFTCDKGMVDEQKVNLSNNYACDEFKINSEQYGPSMKFNFRIKILVVGKDSLEVDNLRDNLNRFGDQANFYFKIMSIDYKGVCPENQVSYNKLLEDNYTPGFITIIIVCDNIRFEEEFRSRIDGAALGIPTLEDPTLGKPVLFVRNSVAYGKILHHELCHLYSGQHTFKDYDMANKGMNCETRYGDGQPDTVTPLRVGSIGEQSCEYYAPEEALKDYSRDEILNMVKNPMSYSPEKCMGLFTESQIQKMRKMVEINSRLQDCII